MTDRDVDRRLDQRRPRRAVSAVLCLPIIVAVVVYVADRI